PQFSTNLWSATPANTNGVNLQFPTVGSQLTSPGGANGTTNAANSATPSSRNATALLVEDNVTWLKGAHSLTMGASATQYTLWSKNQMLVPNVTFGVLSSDPAIAMFNAFQPGVRAASTTLPQYTEGQAAYDLDKNNVAPSVGAVWTPDKREGWLGALMGPEGNFVIRGGYARNYSRPGLTDFSTPF